MKGFKRLVRWGILLLLAAVVVTGVRYVYRTFYAYDYDDTLDESKLGIGEPVNPAPQGGEQETKTAQEIINIALFGVDARHGENSRSDAIMIVSIDGARGKIKLSSIMRDSYVDVKDHGMTKICHAYAYGGPELAINTINRNFDLDIREYATVNFQDLAKIVDIIGGVEIDVQKNEVKELNRVIREYAQENGLKAKTIQEAGLQTLNGMQALSYARVRKGTTGGDVARMGRQQELMSAIFDKVSGMNPVQYPGLVSELMPLVTTSLSSKEVLDVGMSAIKSGMPKIERASFPCEGDWTGKTVQGGMWVAAYSDEVAIEKMHAFIYDDIAPDAEKTDSSGNTSAEA